MYKHLDNAVVLLALVHLALCDDGGSIGMNDIDRYYTYDVDRTDPEKMLLRGGTFKPVLSKAFGVYVYSKPGGYSQAVKEFNMLMFHNYVKEWGDGTMAGYVGDKVVILMRGPFPGHGWMRILSPKNPDAAEKRIMYIPYQDTDVDEMEDDEP